MEKYPAAELRVIWLNTRREDIETGEIGNRLTKRSFGVYQRILGVRFFVGEFFQEPGAGLDLATVADVKYQFTADFFTNFRFSRIQMLICPVSAITKYMRLYFQ